MWTLFGLLACGGGKAPPAPTPVVDTSPAPASAQAEVMQKLSYGVHLAVDEVTLQGSRDQQQGLGAMHMWVSLQEPAHFEPGRDLLLERITAARDAEHLTAYATALGALGQACGDCHRATNGGPAIAADRVPAQVWGDASHMVKHKWAVEWLWVGLVTGDDAAWGRGAEAIADLPDWSGDGDAKPDWVGPFEVHVRDLIRQAPITPTEARPALFGQIVAACAECHQRR
jgi:cytochrome c556